MRVRGFRFMSATAAGVVLAGMSVVALPAAASAMGVAAAPGAPVKVVAVPSARGALVTWQPPASDGGSPVTGYVVSALPGGLSVRTSVVRSYLTGGLVNGRRYRFTVAAVNASGSGPASKASAAVTPHAPGVPGPARSVKAVAGPGRVTVSWSAPRSDGGAPVTGYRVAASPGAARALVAGDARSAVLTGLKDGAAYQVGVAAVNSAGQGRPGRSARVRAAVTAPGVPAGVTAVPVASGVVVSWQPPLETGGSSVRGYVIKVTGQRKTITAGPAARSVKMTGVKANVSHTFEVAARSAHGRGPWITSAPAAAGGKVGAKVVVLSKASLAHLTAVLTNGSLEFTSPAPAQLRFLTAGDIVVAGVSHLTPGGLLVQVTSVSAARSVVVVATKPASLDHALSAARFGTKTTLTSGQVAGFTPARAGVKLIRPAALPARTLGTLSLSLDTTLWKSSNGRKVTVSGSISLTPAMAFSSSTSCCTHTTSQFTGTLTAAASLSITAAASHDISGGYTLAKITFDPIVLDILGVPVVIVPALTVKLIAKGSVTAGLTAEAGEAVTVGVQVTSQDGHVAAHPVYSRTTAFTPPAFSGSMDAAAGAEADLSSTVDGLDGPSVTDDLWLAELSVNPFATPWWTLDAENVISLDYNLKLLGRALANYHATLSDETIRLAQAADPYQQVIITPSPATVPPGGQLQLHALVAGVAAQRPQWAAAPGNGIVTAGGLYTAPHSPGVYQVTAAQPASGLAPASYGLIAIQVGEQPPGPPRAPAASSASEGTATITWSPPSDTGGGPITGYTVTAHPGGRTQAVPGTSSNAAMTGLTPGGSYTFTVTAAGGGGISLASAATNPVVIDNTGGGGGSWTADEAPLPANAAAPYPGPALDAVACPSTSECIAAGTYIDTSGDYQGLVLTGSGRTWIAAEARLPANSIGRYSPYLSSVACPSTTACIAVGSYFDASDNSQGLLVTGSGRTWAATEAPLPGNAGSDPDVFLSAVACQSTSSCTAVGYYADAFGDQQGLLLTGSGRTWTAAQAPLPTGGTGLGSLNSVACPSTSECVAVGSYADSSGKSHGLVLTGSGHTWMATKAPLPANANGGGSLSGVACPAISVCTAVGGYLGKSGDDQGLVLTGSGSRWRATETPLPANANGGGGLSGVACSSAFRCAADGIYNTTTAQPAFTVTGSGSTWTVAATPLPANSDGGGALWGVACSSASECTVYGAYGTTAGRQEPFTAIGWGNTWTAAATPVPGNAYIDSTGVLDAMSCPSSSTCIAVGSYDDSNRSLQAFLVTRSGT